VVAENRAKDVGRNVFGERQDPTDIVDRNGAVRDGVSPRYIASADEIIRLRDLENIQDSLLGSLGVG
tara:strand:+ start:98 stop:298 length:201 start_codon:yes stop_codon:yes gene_type:complete